MITVVKVRDLIAAGEAAKKCIEAIDMLIESNAFSGWPGPVRFVVPKADRDVASWLERIYAAGGWRVKIDIDERDRIGNELSVTLILTLPEEA